MANFNETRNCKTLTAKNDKKSIHPILAENNQTSCNTMEAGCAAVTSDGHKARMSIHIVD